jgi:arylsulfatase A-like enzyme
MQQSGQPYNVVVICLDTLRRDHIGANGNTWIRTPSLDRFAREAAVFERAYIGSFPTIPCRTDLFTGRTTWPQRGWTPLPRDLPVLATLFSARGYTTALIADTYHLFRDGHQFDRGFHTWQWVRGQEGDRCIPDLSRSITLPCAPEKLRNPERIRTVYLPKTAERQCEADYFAPQTMTTALRWLECNRTVQPFLLWIDEFDPHEPWDPPQHYIDMYDSGYQGEQVISPLNGPAGYLSPAELKQVQALYAGEVTMVDRWVGRVLDAIDDLGLRERTIVLVLSDHGHYLDYPGDQGRIGKPAPLFEGVAHQNFMLRHPAGLGGGQLHSALVQPVDLLPTLLDLTGGTIPGFCEGSSLRGVLDGGTSNRQVAISAPHRGVPTITSQDWSFIFVPPTSVGAARLDGQTNELVRNGSAQWTSLLFDLRNDPLQQHDVLAGHHQEARDLYAAFAAFLHERNPAALDLYPPPAW